MKEKIVSVCPRCRGSINLHFEEEEESELRRRKCDFCGAKYMGREYTGRSQHVSYFPVKYR